MSGIKEFVQFMSGNVDAIPSTDGRRGFLQKLGMAGFAGVDFALTGHSSFPPKETQVSPPLDIDTQETPSLSPMRKVWLSAEEDSQIIVNPDWFYGDNPIFDISSGVSTLVYRKLIHEFGITEESEILAFNSEINNMLRGALNYAYNLSEHLERIYLIDEDLAHPLNIVRKISYIPLLLSDDPEGELDLEFNDEEINLLRLCHENIRYGDNNELTVNRTYDRIVQREIPSDITVTSAETAYNENAEQVEFPVLGIDSIRAIDLNIATHLGALPSVEARVLRKHDAITIPRILNELQLTEEKATSIMLENFLNMIGILESTFGLRDHQIDYRFGRMVRWDYYGGGGLELLPDNDIFKNFIDIFVEIFKNVVSRTQYADHYDSNYSNYSDREAAEALFIKTFLLYPHYALIEEKAPENLSDVERDIAETFQASDIDRPSVEEHTYIFAHFMEAFLEESTTHDPVQKNSYMTNFAGRFSSGIQPSEYALMEQLSQNPYTLRWFLLCSNRNLIRFAINPVTDVTYGLGGRSGPNTFVLGLSKNSYPETTYAHEESHNLDPWQARELFRTRSIRPSDYYWAKAAEFKITNHSIKIAFEEVWGKSRSLPDFARFMGTPSWGIDYPQWANIRRELGIMEDLTASVVIQQLRQNHQLEEDLEATDFGEYNGTLLSTDLLRLTYTGRDSDCWSDPRTQQMIAKLLIHLHHHSLGPHQTKAIGLTTRHSNNTATTSIVDVPGDPGHVMGNWNLDAGAINTTHLAERLRLQQTKLIGFLTDAIGRGSFATSAAFWNLPDIIERDDVTILNGALQQFSRHDPFNRAHRSQISIIDAELYTAKLMLLGGWRAFNNNQGGLDVEDSEEQILEAWSEILLSDNASYIGLITWIRNMMRTQNHEERNARLNDFVASIRNILLIPLPQAKSFIVSALDAILEKLDQLSEGNMYWIVPENSDLITNIPEDTARLNDRIGIYGDELMENMSNSNIELIREFRDYVA